MQEPEGPHERLLGRVVGEAHAGDGGGRASGVVLVAAHQLAVRLDVPVLGPLDQLDVVRDVPSTRPLGRGVTGCTPAAGRRFRKRGGANRTDLVVLLSVADVAVARAGRAVRPRTSQSGG